MGMTITEKIIASHSGKDVVRAGEFVYADIDVCLGNDITAPLAIEEFDKTGIERVFDPAKIVLVPDHFTPNKDIKSAAQARVLRDFAQRQGISNYFEVGRMGIEHALLPERGLVLSGDLVIGADSHTCTYGALGAFSTGVGSTDLAAAFATGKVWLRVPETVRFLYRGKPTRWVSGKDLILYTIGKIGVDGALYKAMELTGETIQGLDMDNRLTMCNMAIEAGAKSGVIAPDKTTENYVRDRARRPYRLCQSDADCTYSDVVELDVDRLSPQVAKPSLPENVAPVEELADVAVDQVVIGSCTNGRIGDLRVAAKILHGRRAARSVRLIVIPATQAVYMQAIKEHLIETFIEAQAVVSTPTCGPCLGGHMGVLAEGETCVSTTNRNFVGRMGHPKSNVYLASPAVAAASAVTGRITHPKDVC